MLWISLQPSSHQWGLNPEHLACKHQRQLLAPPRLGWPAYTISYPRDCDPRWRNGMKPLYTPNIIYSGNEIFCTSLFLLQINDRNFYFRWRESFGREAWGSSSLHWSTFSVHCLVYIAINNSDWNDGTQMASPTNSSCCSQCSDNQ